MALDSIEGSLKERGVRLTRQRQILLELIDRTGEHLDAERLYQMAGLQFILDQRQADQCDAMPRDGRLDGVSLVGKAQLARLRRRQPLCNREPPFPGRILGLRPLPIEADQRHARQVFGRRDAQARIRHGRETVGE